LTDDKICEGYLAPISNIFENFPLKLLSIPDTKKVFENKRFHHIECCNNMF